MKIAIDVTPMESAHSRRGVGLYTKNLVSALEKYAPSHSYTLFTRGQKVPDNADLVHFPYFDPFFLTLPLVKTKPAIVTVHDLIPLVFPDKFPAGLKGTLKWQAQKLSLLGAKRILADSKCSKSDISRITGFDTNRIDVVYLAPDPVFEIPPVRKPSGKKPYFLYVGDVNWNKNVTGLIRAFAPLKKYELVLVGSAFTDPHLSETKEINVLISALGIEHSVRRVGYVTDRELTGLYAGAMALVQPSFYEGFGLPVLEAMRCGCPVVVSDTSSLSEIAGPAIRVKPDTESIKQGMRKIVTLDRKTQVKLQFDWVRRFSWKLTAAGTVKSYEKVLESL